jgi:hypothetical protein
MAKRRSGTGWLIGIVVLLAILWVGYWAAANYAATVAVARANARGLQCATLQTAGFPLQVDIDCTKAAFARDGATADIGGIAARVPLYLPGKVNARLQSPLTVNLPGKDLALTATWTAGSAGAGAWIDGLNAADAAFTTLKLESTGSLPVKSVAADSASGAVTPAGGGSYNLAASLHRLALTGADGTAYPTLDLDANATAQNVGALGTDPQRALLAWLRGTPKVNIKRLRIAANDAIISLSGDLSLSKDGLPNGNRCSATTASTRWRT